ncbi:unnamed protein product [Caenorhabditis bovis]|uniref:Uncharacterized protein n=1 Tax=Caenorhabditis bovis TaxID=2654633 RepID=A0A8S1FEP9_9PELO|nr:unnamed protein product [Caenorhabditis bovis]
MTKVGPASDQMNEASTSKFATKKGIESLVACVAKIFGTVTRKWDRRPSRCSSDESIESGITTPRAFNIPTYNQSSTRKLAFGTPATDERKPLNDFYNNTTLTNVSKLFCAVVLITAFLLVMSRSLQFVYDFPNSSSINDLNYININHENFRINDTDFYQEGLLI